MIACSPSAFPASLITLVTLKTLITLAICGPIVRNCMSEPKISSKISKILETTTKKSKRFHAF